jgi:hypothetical protein
MSDKFDKACKKSLDELLAYFEGNKAEMARQLKVSRNTVSTWFTVGRIGRIGAERADRSRKIPFSLEQLRPDIHARREQYKKV